MNGPPAPSFWLPLAQADDNVLEPLLIGTAIVALAFAAFALWVMVRRRREWKCTSTVEPMLLVARDGAERQVLGNAAPLRNAGGAVSGVVFAFRDVTERELADSAYRVSQEMFRIITDHISDYIAVLDLK